jgi:hypothetical protein
MKLGGKNYENPHPELADSYKNYNFTNTANKFNVR